MQLNGRNIAVFKEKKKKEKQASDCPLIFGLEYRSPNSTIRLLGAWFPVPPEGPARL